MVLKTTVVGAWPKPDGLDLPDWFNDKVNRSTRLVRSLEIYQTSSIIQGRELSK